MNEREGERERKKNERKEMYGGKREGEVREGLFFALVRKYSGQKVGSASSFQRQRSKANSIGNAKVSK